MILLDALTFFGRLHPLIVHLPVGFLILAIFFQLLAYWPRFNYIRQAVPLTLFAGFLTAVLSCVFGYMLSLTGDYDRIMLRHHKWAGISLAIVSGILYLISTGKLRFIPRYIYFGAFVIMAGLMTYTGHQGGMLTHGSDFLTMQTLLKHKRPRPASLDQAFIFEDVVHPILESRCGQCHEGSKLKGRLSVASLKDLLRGGKHGPAIVAGKPAESELFKRITLDPGQEKFMPTDGKTPLKKNEVAIIKWWIEKANAVENQKLVALKQYQDISPKVALYLGLTTDASAEDQEAFNQPVNPAIPAAVDTGAVESLRRKGWMVRYMLKKPAMLDMIIPANGKAVLDDSRTELQKISKNIVWLNLADSNLDDAQLSFLSSLVNLEKLRLEKNPLTDAVCNNLVKLNHLEAVNLNETKVTDSGILILKRNPSIKRVYSWEPVAKKS